MVTVLVLVVINGGRRGFLKESAMLVGVVLGAVAARQLGPLLAKAVWRDGVAAQNAILAYLSVLVIVLIIVAALAAMIRPVLSNPTLRTLDLMAGLALGACEGLLLIGTATSVASRLNLVSGESSRLAPLFASWSVAMMHYLPGDLRSIDRLIWLGSSLPLT
jgi:uncharacterized membrane protein required for colicin V production